jgi:hypothetical protein
MAKIKLPAHIESLKDGPHKRDLIRQYKKRLKRRLNDNKTN